MSSNSKIAVPSFATKRVYNRDDRSLNVQMYDIDNLYPQRVRNAINSSGTATACTNLLSKHLRGRGYKDKNLETLVVNEYQQTLGDIHKLLCNDRAMYLGYAFHITYNAMLQPVSIKYVPFEFIRLTLPDDAGNTNSVKIHPDWGRESGKAFDRKQLIEVDLYTDNIEVMYQQINKVGGFENWKGHIYYYSEKGKLIYPPAVCDPVFEDVLTDAGIKMWKFRGVSTDFMANYFWIFNGEFADEHEKLDYVEAVNSFQGVDNSHKIIVVECPTPNSKPELLKVERQDNDKVYELTESTVVENIVRSYGQPKALHSISVSGSLGLTKEIEEGKIVYDERTSDDRNNLGNVFKAILNNWYEGNPSDDYLIIPITGFAEEKKNTISDIISNEMVSGLQSVITDTGMNPQQKINFIVAVYGVNYEIASAIVLGTPLPTNI
jgi:hypothetical protein